MLAPREMPLNFVTPEAWQRYFKEHAEYYVCFSRVDRFTYRSEHRSLNDARAAGALVARTLSKPALIYSVIGSSDAWLENVYPKN
jgi:hypothetical protein